MKTIQIPLELAEKLLSSLRDIARHNCKVFGIPDTTTEHYLSENYHKLKKLVEEQTTGTVEKHENSEMYRIWRFPFISLEEQEEHDRIKEEYLKTEMPRFPDDLLPDSGA